MNYAQAAEEIKVAELLDIRDCPRCGGLIELREKRKIFVMYCKTCNDWIQWNENKKSPKRGWRDGHKTKEIIA